MTSTKLYRNKKSSPLSKMSLKYIVTEFNIEAERSYIFYI